MELVVKDVHVTLGKAKIVNGVSLHVGERQSVGIIGPNGCGKSTLLKAIYRVNPIDSGEVLLNGQNVTKMSPKEAARHIAVVGQFNELAFDFSVQDMVLMGRSPHKKMWRAIPKPTTSWWRIRCARPSYTLCGSAVISRFPAAKSSG